MFERTQLEVLLELHRRSYALIQWVSGQIGARRLALEDLRRAMRDASAAADWLRRSAATLPAEARPPAGEEGRFASLLASYLSTSLEIASHRLLRARCGHRRCGQVIEEPHLRSRAPSAADEAIAAHLELDCLEALAEEEGLALFREELERLRATHPALAHALPIVAYVRELERRTTYRGQGQPVLALWRKIAWAGTHPDRGFALTAEGVLEAMRTIRGVLRDFTI